MDIITLPHYEGLELPKYESDQAAAIDLRAAITDTITLAPGQDTIIPSGLKFDMTTYRFNTFEMYSSIMHNMFNIAGIMLPRSGLGFKHYVRLANTCGLIDVDYQGEVMIKVRNEGTGDLLISRGDRICQMYFTVVLKDVKFKVVPEFKSSTSRGEKGIGSSGKN